MTDSEFLDIAARLALESLDSGGSASGAVLARGDTIIAKSGDRSRQLNDPIAVAEMNCIREAGRRNDQPELTLYSTRYPDMLAAGTLLQFSIGALVVGLPEISNQAIDLLRSRDIALSFIEHQLCISLNTP